MDGREVGGGSFSVSRRRIVFQLERTVVRSGSLSIIKNCQMHFGRCGRITVGAREPVESSPGVSVGYSPGGRRGGKGARGRRRRRRRGKGMARPARISGVYGCAIISQCIITRTDIN